MTDPADDDLDLVDRLRAAADALPTPAEARRRSIEVGLALGLPLVWLEALPTIDLLPEGYWDGPGPDDRYGPDSSLRFKALEHLVRAGRLAELGPDELDLIAEALENESVGDGPTWMRDRVQDTMFCVAWPRRTYSLHVDLQVAAEGILDAIEGSPSSLLYAGHDDIERCWRMAAHRVHALDPHVDLPEASPWPDLASVLRAAASRIDEGREMERRRVRNEPVPEQYRHFLADGVPGVDYEIRDIDGVAVAGTDNFLRDRGRLDADAFRARVLRDAATEGRTAIAGGDYVPLRNAADISAEVERLSAEAGQEDQFHLLDEWDDGHSSDRRETVTTSLDEAMQQLTFLDFRVPRLIEPANQKASGPDRWAWERRDGSLFRRASITRRAASESREASKPTVNAERVNDLAKRLLHRLVARRLPHEPDLLARARERVRAPDDGRPQPEHLAEWRSLLDLPTVDLRRRITARNETMDRLRSSSPLVGDGDYADVDLRRRIWRAARRIAVHQGQAILRAYSEGRLSRTEAVLRLGLRDYAGLLVALGDAGLPMPMPPEDEIERQAETFEWLWHADTDTAADGGDDAFHRWLASTSDRLPDDFEPPLSGARDSGGGDGKKR